MRFTNVFLGIAGVGAVAAVVLAGCGSSESSTAGTGASSTTGTMSTGTSTTGTMSTGTSSTSSGGSCSGSPCSPMAACGAADDCCIGLVDNTGKTTFGLRMNQLNVSAPAKLATGAVATIIAGDVTPSLPNCNLMGSGDFTWLLQFDTTANTLKTGGAQPVSDPTMGYSFVSTTISGDTIAPITFSNVTIGSNGSFSTTPYMGKLYVPIYLDTMGDAVVLPILNPSIGMSTLSANQNCIGSYNAAALSPANSCAGSTTTPAFVTGGSLNGLITIADADTVVISELSETLCVLLTGTTGSTTNSIAHCVSSSGTLPMSGDACSTGGSCMDSFTLAASFAASSILINN